VDDTEELALILAAFLEVTRERDNLRAEIAELKLITDWADMDKLRAENHELRAKLAECERDLAIWEAPAERW
jgi:hypothetical protein